MHHHHHHHVGYFVHHFGYWDKVCVMCGMEFRFQTSVHRMCGEREVIMKFGVEVLLAKEYEDCYTSRCG